MSEERQWKFPVGTVREWSQSRVIKTHDNGPMDDIISPWMNYPTIPSEFTNGFRDCDRIARSIFSYKEPVEGELWLDKEFEKFVTKSGKEFTGQQFKAFSPFKKGIFGYDFVSELSQRYLGDKIAFNAKLAEELQSANEDKRNRLRSGGEEAHDGIILTKDEIAEIKEKLRSEFKYDDSQKLVLQDVKDILSKLGEIEGYLKQGKSFEGEQATVYDSAKKLLSELDNGPYVSIGLVKSNVRDMLRLMNTTFTSNWGICESYRKKITSKLDDFISKYRKEIERDELENFNKLLDGDLYGPTNVFYKKLRESKMFSPIDVNDPKYIGQLIQSPYDYDSKYDDYVLKKVSINSEDDDGTTYYDVWYQDSLSDSESIKTVKESKLQDMIRSKQTESSSLDVPMKLRFRSLYGKNLSGSWEENDITLLEMFEKLTGFLPKGHLLNNSLLENLRKENYLNGSDNSYAHFDFSNKEMFLSSQCLSKQEIGITDLDNGNEIASVLIHEVGHALSKKIGRRDSMPYKKFVRECGWSWEQFQYTDSKKNITLDNNYIATGSDKDIKRQGTKSDVPLITEYAHKSPEEAFAEYYSFYTQYKSRIDNFLVTKQETLLNKDKAFNLQSTNKKYSDFLRENQRHLSDESSRQIVKTRSEIQSILSQQNRGDDHFKVDVIDPYYDNLVSTKEEHVNKNIIVSEKTVKTSYSTNFQTPNPVFTIYDKHLGKHDIVNSQQSKDAPIHYANKYLRRLTPTFSISKECFNLLSEKGYSFEQIRDYTLSTVGNSPIPKVKETKLGTASTFGGLKYRGEVIPASKIVKMESIFSHMKLIWESEDLKKALQELGILVEEEEIESMNEIEKSSLSTLPGIFSDAINKIKSVLKKSSSSKQKYGDVVVRNYCGDVLLLQRSYQDDFMPGKWCLPGGKIEEGEDFITGAKRELKEETGLDLDLVFLKELEKDDCIINYFEAKLTKPFASVLDNEEHYRQQFVPLEQLSEYEMIYNLCETIKSLPLSIIVDVDTQQLHDSQFIKDLLLKQKQLKELFDTDKIDVEEYLYGVYNIKEQSFNFIKSCFDKGIVTEEDYFSARESFEKIKKKLK